MTTERLERLKNLSPQKRALLLKALQKEAAQTQESKAIPRRVQQTPCVLSFAQQRLWFLTQLDLGSTAAYNIPAAVRLKGVLDVGVLEISLNKIVSRHEALRTTFTQAEGQPVQAIAPSLTLVLPIVDLQELPEAKREAEVHRLVRKEAQRSFNLENDPLLRVTLLRLGEAEHVVLFTMHHIISDGWSMGVLIKELVTLYEAFSTGLPSPLPELPIQYADFAVWQRQWLQGEVRSSQLAYWKEQLNGATTLLALPTDRPRPAVQSFHGGRQTWALSLDLSQALMNLSQQQGVTLFMTLLAAFQTLLYRYTRQDDICVGTPIANRNRAEIEGLIGFFVNTLVLRTDLSGNPSFVDLLSRVREVALGANAHQDLPFEQLVEELQPRRDLSHTPLFQVMFVLQNAPIPSLEFKGLNLTPLVVESSTAKFDLTLSLENTLQGLIGSWEYNTDLFDAATIASMAGHFQTLLEGIIVDPHQSLSSLPILNAVEQQQLLLKWNDTKANYPQDVFIHQLFEAQVEQTPDAVAVVFGNKQLTYQELNCRANQLAHHLQALGVKPEVLVGICVERSLEMVVGLLGILKAGGAYLPLDPVYPKERLAFMLEDAQVPVLLTQQQLVEKLPDQQARMVIWETDWEAITQHSQKNPVREVTSDNLAYVLYTSGSTGIPKGVAIEHRSPVNLVNWAKEVFTPAHCSGVLASTSICFDLSVFELFVPLSWGNKIILAENALHLSTLPAAKEVTLINTVPSAIAELQRIDAIPASVHTVNLAGEPLQNQLVQKIYQQGTIQQVFNLYGPSEDTTYSTFALVEKGATKPPTIGCPIANTQIYILDNQMQPVPVGVAGELYISGAGLARGYLNHPELTAERFISNPFSKLKLENTGESSSHPNNSHLYKTGDLARYLPSGEIEYLGRIDQQVKIRGFRIELGEIEAVLGQHPSLREVVVIAQEDVSGNQCLVAYVVLNQINTPASAELRQFLKQKLPEYMIPSAFVLLEALPLTPNGKVDRRALPTPEKLRPDLEAAYVEPQTEIERLIAAVLQEKLQIVKVGIYDNFFDLGGHSLLLVQIHSKLQEILEQEISIIDLFQYPSISSLAKYLSQDKNQKTTGQPSKNRADKRNVHQASVHQQSQFRQKHRAKKK